VRAGGLAGGAVRVGSDAGIFAAHRDRLVIARITPLCRRVPRQITARSRLARTVALTHRQELSMTPEQIARVRASWALVVPIAESAAAHFYERLFTVDPTLRPLFHQTDLASQRRKLMQTLGVVVAGLADLSRLLPAVEALGRRHVAYGVDARHYAVVGDALLWTFEQGLGDAFDADTRSAWATAYGLLADAMIRAAESAPLESAIAH
jgi:nitric oxide dioxygenase